MDFLAKLMALLVAGAALLYMKSCMIDEPRREKQRVEQEIYEAKKEAAVKKYLEDEGLVNTSDLPEGTRNVVLYARILRSSEAAKAASAPASAASKNAVQAARDRLRQSGDLDRMASRHAIELDGFYKIDPKTYHISIFRDEVCLEAKRQKLNTDQYQCISKSFKLSP